MINGTFQSMIKHCQAETIFGKKISKEWFEENDEECLTKSMPPNEIRINLNGKLAKLDIIDHERDTNSKDL